MDKNLSEIHSALGVTSFHLESTRLLFCEQAQLEDLRVVDIDFEGKPFVLISQAGMAWVEMRDLARKEGVWLMPFSGFRSYLHQRNLIQRLLDKGRGLEQIFTHVAIPGFSEHHSGRAVDVHARDRAVLDEDFEKTSEFLWLKENAGRFGFRLSYPRGNSCGIIYEPWHWFYTGA